MDGIHQDPFTYMYLSQPEPCGPLRSALRDLIGSSPEKAVHGCGSEDRGSSKPELVTRLFGGASGQSRMGEGDDVWDV